MLVIYINNIYTCPYTCIYNVGYNTDYKIIEFVGNIAKTGDRKIITIPTCIVHNFDELQGKKVKITVTPLVE